LIAEVNKVMEKALAFLSWWQSPLGRRNVAVRRVRFEPKFAQEFPIFAPDLAYANERFDICSFRGLVEFEERGFWFAPRNELILWAFKKYLPNASRVLEIGCGTGYVLRGTIQQMPGGGQATGADIHVEGLNFARQRLGNRCDFVQVDATRLCPIATSLIPSAHSTSSNTSRTTSAPCARFTGRLSRGGGFMIIVPQHMFLWSRVDDLAFHKRRYARRELTAKLEKPASSSNASCRSSLF
jgi:SAM-dependent methyltransferase